MPGQQQLVDLLDASAAPMGGNLFGLSREQLRAVFRSFDQPVYRTAQLLVSMFRQRIASLDAVTTLPRQLREEMAKAGWRIALPRIVRCFHSSDGTERYLMAGEDGRTVETVWMPGGDSGEEGDWDKESSTATPELETKRATICVSSQMGCAVGCDFCSTAKLGLQRNLTAGEIAGQVIAVLDRHRVEVGRDRINLVFMGMGEPFLNYGEWMQAVRLLIEEAGLAESRMTVSTSGIVPGILRLAQERVRPRLALSLNASNDAIRDKIMPVTRKWNIERVLEAARQVPLRPRERVTFEYVLLGGVNDGIEQADELVQLAQNARMPVKVNLIAWNPGPQMDYEAPAAERVEAFQRRLRAGGVAAYLRRPRGLDIFAACGQLKLTDAQD